METIDFRDVVQKTSLEQTNHRYCIDRIFPVFFIFYLYFPYKKSNIQRFKKGEYKNESFVSWHFSRKHKQY